MKVDKKSISYNAQYPSVADLKKRQKSGYRNLPLNTWKVDTMKM